MKESLFDYHIFDSRQLKAKVKDQIINATITSPPYWKLKNYNSKNQIGFGQIYDEYLNDMTEIFKDVYNITKNNGSLWIVIDTLKQNKEFKLLPFDLANRLNDIGWKLQDIIIWAKDKNRPWSHKGKLRNIFEYILFFSKSDNFKFYVDRIKEPKKLQNWWIGYPERYNPKGKVPERLWDFPIPTQGSWSNGWIKHFCPFPPKLVERIILLTTNKKDIVFDPFAGSGMVLAQSIAMGRKAIGFDINKTYKDMYEKNVLPYIESQWEKRRVELIHKQRKSIQFSSKIKILRQLKYPKALINKAIKKGVLRLSTINYVFLFGSNKLSSPEIYFNIEGDFKPQHLIKELKLVMARPPLSKYGLIPTLKIMNEEKLENIVENHPFESFFLYKNANTHFYDQKIKRQELLTNKNEIISKGKNKFPNIISNLGIRVSQKKVES